MRSFIHVNILRKKGFEITYIDVDENGILKLDDLKGSDQTRHDPDFCDVCKQRDRNDPAN